MFDFPILSIISGVVDFYLGIFMDFVEVLTSSIRVHQKGNCKSELAANGTRQRSRKTLREVGDGSGSSVAEGA